MNISLYNCMNLSSEKILFCVVHYIALFSSHYFSQDIPLGGDNMLNSPPLTLGQWEPGQRGPGHFNTKTIQHGPPLPTSLQWVHISHTNPSERKYLVYYLVLCPTTHATIYIK